MNRSDRVYARFVKMIESGVSEEKIKKFCYRQSMQFRHRYHMRLTFD